MEKEQRDFSVGLFLTFAGLIGATEVSAFIFWTYLASFGEANAQVLFRNAPPNSIFWWSVPFGVFVGTCLSLFVVNLKNISTLKFSTVIVSCFLAIIIGYPASFLITIISAFGLPNIKIASIGWGFCIVITLICAIVIKVAENKKSSEKKELLDPD